MNRKLAGALALLIAVPGVAITFGDFRAGRSRLWVSGGVRPLIAERLTNPTWFWAFTAINVVLLSLLLIVAVVMILVL